MPIRINLLAEAQAAEEARRRDPVKRAILAGICLILGVLLWSSSLQIKLAAARSRLGAVEAQWGAIEKQYQAAVNHQRQLLEAEEKSAALTRLATNRFLWGTALNALQQSLNGIADVQLVRVKAEQTYTLTEDKAKKDATNKPPVAVEKIVLTLDALDSSPQPGREQIARFKEALAQVPWFQAHLQKTNGVLLTSLSAPQVNAGRRPQVMFTLQCLFPERIR